MRLVVCAWAVMHPMLIQNTPYSPGEVALLTDKMKAKAPTTTDIEVRIVTGTYIHCAENVVNVFRVAACETAARTV